MTHRSLLHTSVAQKKKNIVKIVFINRLHKIRCMKYTYILSTSHNHIEQSLCILNIHILFKMLWPFISPKSLFLRHFDDMLFSRNIYSYGMVYKMVYIKSKNSFHRIGVRNINPSFTNFKRHLNNLIQIKTEGLNWDYWIYVAHHVGCPACRDKR